MGADVVKIERPGRGDDARAWAPPWWGDQSSTFLAFNRNKRSLALDLKTAAGRSVLKRLVARVDVFVQSLSAEATRDLGVDFAGASAMNSRLVYCAITADGTRGPMRDMPGYDPMMQAYAGLMSINGHPGQEPVRLARRSWTWAPACGPPSASSRRFASATARGRRSKSRRRS